MRIHLIRSFLTNPIKIYEIKSSLIIIKTIKQIINKMPINKRISLIKFYLILYLKNK